MVLTYLQHHFSFHQLVPGKREEQLPAATVVEAGGIERDIVDRTMLPQ
jgi:hypothetical protein